MSFHAAASRLAAMSVSNSAVTPASRARGKPSKAAHHSAGIQSRCHHLETELGGCPISAPSAARVGHSSITSRKEPKVINRTIGHAVLDCKGQQSLGRQSLDKPVDMGQNVLMGGASRQKATAQPRGRPKTQTQIEFERRFIQNTKHIREKSGLSQNQIAEALELKQDRYKQYETRTTLPHHLIPEFLLACGASYSDLYKGRVFRTPPVRAS